MKICGSRIRGFPADLASEHDRKELTEWVRNEAPGGVDLLIHSAGQAHLGEVENLSNSAFIDSFSVQVLALTDLVKCQLPNWKTKRGSSLVVISSGVAYRGLPENAAYCVSKAAQLALAETLSVELSKFGVRVVTVSPGLISTQFREKAVVFGNLNWELANGRTVTVKKAVDRCMRVILRARAGHYEFSLRARIVRILNAFFPCAVTGAIRRKYFRGRSS
jgi:short-subunit dehydrogenase